MASPLAVVVNAAGLGTRLGSHRPKCLVEVAGRSLLHWQLAMLRYVHDVRVVVGHQADLVQQAVLDVRPDALIRYNPEYASTGTAASLMLGASGIEGPVLSLDCDLVVHPEDLEAFLRRPAPVLGVLPVQSLEPVTVQLAQGSEGMLAERFGRVRRPGWVEWSGLVSFDPRDAALGPRQGHVFELIEPLLPIPATVIRAVELDFPEELPTMEAWISALSREGHLTWI